MNTRVETCTAGMVAGKSLDRFWQQIRAWARIEMLKYRLRQERRQLAAMSDEMLRDIGISRAAAELEAGRTDIPAARLNIQAC